MVCCYCIYFTTELIKPLLCCSSLNIILRASKPSWIWYDFCQNLIIKILQKNHVVISLTLRFLEDFKIFLIMKMIEKIVRYLKFLVACTRLYTPLCPSVGRSVGWLVTLYFFYDFIFLTSLLLPKWSGDLKYGPCPPARDFGSRVSGLV